MTVWPHSENRGQPPKPVISGTCFWSEKNPSDLREILDPAALLFKKRLARKV